jgi:hypothetical protein
MLLLVLAIADFGRVYEAMVAIESATREAADYGAFNSSYWDASVGNPATTTAEMQRRACTAAAGSHVEGYGEPGGTLNHSACSNPTFTCTIKPPVASGEASQACASYGGTYCSTSTSDPPCTVDVTLTFNFQAFLSVPPLPTSVSIQRQSNFRVSDLPVAP